MSYDSARFNQVLVFSPPRKNVQREINPSEFLLLKPFSKAPSLPIVVQAPGESATVPLTVQNIDDNPSRLYFEIPAGKNIVIRPETSIIQPQSVEVFEVTAVEPKESFRASIKIFAPDIKYYRGGQFSVIVNVKKIIETEKKKKKPKPALPALKPKAVTVPEEFVFQPSREERKKKTSVDHTEGKENGFRPQAFDLSSKIEEIPTTDLEQIRRQAAALKQNLIVNQTYSIIRPTSVLADFNDPIVLVKNQLGTSRSLVDVTRAVMKYAEHTKAAGPDSACVSKQHRQAINAIMIQHAEALERGDLTAVLIQLGLEFAGDFREQPANVFPDVRISEESQAPKQPTRTTSSPKQGEAPDDIETRAQGRYNFIRASLAMSPDMLLATDEGPHDSSMKEVKSPNVSAIFTVSRLS